MVAIIGGTVQTAGGARDQAAIGVRRDIECGYGESAGHLSERPTLAHVFAFQQAEIGSGEQNLVCAALECVEAADLGRRDLLDDRPGLDGARGSGMRRTSSAGAASSSRRRGFFSLRRRRNDEVDCEGLPGSSGVDRFVHLARAGAEENARLARETGDGGKVHTRETARDVQLGPGGALIAADKNAAGFPEL